MMPTRFRILEREVERRPGSGGEGLQVLHPVLDTSRVMPRPGLFLHAGRPPPHNVY
jgi:hypothetical protein